MVPWQLVLGTGMALTGVALEGNHRLARDIHPLPGGMERDTEADVSLLGTPGGAVGNICKAFVVFLAIILFFVPKATFYNLLSMLCPVGFEASMHVESPRPPCVSVNSLWRAHTTVEVPQTFKPQDDSSCSLCAKLL